MVYDAAVTKCTSYDYGECRNALHEVIESVGGLDFVKKGTRVVIKANLVSAMKPEKAATTHPVMVCALCDMLYEKGASVVVGDSSGGIYNLAFMSRVYALTGMREVEDHHAKLNTDFGESKARFDDGITAKEFFYTSYLDNADYIIDFCKLKTHGMMGLSAGAKNMFGVVPGIIKPEYHYKYPDPDDFASMIVDLNEYFKPILTICDGVYGMEGNGPTAGTPRYIGTVIASASPHKLDMLCATIIDTEPKTIRTLNQAMKRKLIPETIDELNIYGDYKRFIVKDYEKLPVNKSFQFGSDSKTSFGRLTGKVVKKCLRAKPKLNKKECVGCSECCKICPAKAIVMVDKKPEIDRKKCICCFCCQEFCPKGAIKVSRTAIARIFSKNRQE